MCNFIKIYVLFFQTVSSYTMLYLRCCRLPNWQQEGGERMSILISLIVSVVAGVISYYICKWLDGKHGDN